MENQPPLININAVNHDPIDILLVEDDEADVKITLKAFKDGKLKNNVYAVGNGIEALDFLHNRNQYQDEERFPRPDLILLDIQMPKLNGFDTLKRIKEDPQTDFIPVIMLTSSENEEDIIKSYRDGAVSYIQKPIAFKEFGRLVEGFNFYWQIVNKLPDRDH